jgi:hypothetical protein
MKRKLTEPTIELVKHTEFNFMRYESVQRVVLALSMSGYYVKVNLDDAVYFVEVYKHQNTL